MPEKYHIHTKTASPRFHPVGKYATVEFREDCAGSCRACVKKKCVYEIFKKNYKHMSTVKEPEYLYECQSCFRCVQECTKGIFSRVINPEYRTLGDDYWRADVIFRTWYQAHTGKIPVSGAGYRGPFVGKGFDAMWTDMSEIVRPTRDGIHGREYINTCIELSRRVPRLAFDKNMDLTSDAPPVLEIPLPLLFQKPAFRTISGRVLISMASAAKSLGTFLFIDPEDYGDPLTPYTDALIPRLAPGNWTAFQELVKSVKMVELAYAPDIATEFEKLRSVNPKVIISAGIPLDAQAADIAARLAETDADTLHFYADEKGNEANAEDPRFIKEMIREVHLRLVEALRRQKINLLFSGGVAMAEHMAKAIICGADGVVIDNPLLVALECRLCRRCADGVDCPVRLDDVNPVWGGQRIVNLMGAWRNQLIEVMGAMGMREARRLRGEVGRSMWFEDLEKENFGPIFGERKVSELV